MTCVLFKMKVKTSKVMHTLIMSRLHLIVCFSFGRVVFIWNSMKQGGINKSFVEAECVYAATDQKNWSMKFYQMKVENMRSILRVFSRK